MKTNWLSAALILGAAGSDGAGALASEVAGPLAGVKVSQFSSLLSSRPQPFSIFLPSPCFSFTLPPPITSFPFVLSFVLANHKQTPRDSLSLSLYFDMFDIDVFISDVEDIFIISVFIAFCLTVGWPFAPFLCLIDYVLDLGIIF
jgi:hypothetical protein